jgi:GT2 family glycosyltransferase
VPHEGNTRGANVAVAEYEKMGSLARPLVGLGRPQARGKFLFVGEEKLYVRGVTYGAFRPDSDGHEYFDLDRIDADFARMAEHGFNAVRIPHTNPPLHLLDIAERHGLFVMVGLSCEQYVGYLIDRRRAPDIAQSVRAKARACAGHPALLCYALGNEIPASVARWIGPRRIERYLQRLYDTVKREDPDAIVTYVNYPTTEYLDLGFLDMLAFNVYLEQPERLAAYLARLHHLAGERPLLMSELGLDSLRNGEEEQACQLQSQIRTTFESGCAGAFVFSWTDEWYRGGADVHDWAFGLTDAERRPKPALHAVRKACRGVPFSERDWPRVSVVVCAYNAAETIGETLEGLTKLDYPDYEVIVVNDGSTDGTEQIASGYELELISTPNRGLSTARNTGLWRATGEIVAYLDADATPDPHWLRYLAASFDDQELAAVGGPNIAPPGDGPIAHAIGNAPGNPTHVMLCDRIAEHIPGCNMAFRRQELLEVGGFDPRFHTAGDDVDICWRIQDRGRKIGFSPAAVVWHHPRGSVRGFLRQQVGYGAAEGQLEEKWPERHNSAGHKSWSGRIYGPGRIVVPRSRGVIYQGTWGSAPFQSVYERGPGSLRSLTASAEWRLLVAALLLITAMGALWTPLFVAAPLALLSATMMLRQAWLAACEGPYPTRARRLRMLTAALYVLQPLARLRGRARTRRKMHLSNLRLAMAGVPLLARRHSAYWSSVWREPAAWLADLLAELKNGDAIVCVSNDYDNWDLLVRSGRLGGAKLLAAFEDNGSGNQYLRFRVWPSPSRVALVLGTIGLVVALASGAAGATYVSVVFGAATLLIVTTVIGQCAAAVVRLWRVVPADPQAE